MNSKTLLIIFFINQKESIFEQAANFSILASNLS